MRERFFVVGDVHGCLEELDELLRVASFRPGVDRLAFVGDLLDRGPDPVGVVRRARELGAISVLGNHEEKHLRFRRHELRAQREPGYRNPLRSFDAERLAQHRALSEDDWAWIASLPTWMHLPGNFYVVHGGFEPRWPMHTQRDRIVIRIRDVDENGKFVAGRDPRVRVPGSVPWATRWRRRAHVVYGHSVHGFEQPRVDRFEQAGECWGIDTGCVYGGHLTALELRSREVFQVRAAREYVPFDRAILD